MYKLHKTSMVCISLNLFLFCLEKRQKERMFLISVFRFAVQICHVKLIFHFLVGQRAMKSAELLFDFLVGRKSAHTKDEPRRADISLGNSLLCKTEQKDQQEKTVCFHDVILMTIKQHTQSNTLTQCSTLQHPKVNISSFTVDVIHSLLNWTFVESLLNDAVSTLTKYGLVFLVNCCVLFYSKFQFIIFFYVARCIPRKCSSVETKCSTGSYMERVQTDTVRSRIV